MPNADVVVVGAGLAGLAAAHGLAERGARVVILAKGFASTHWTAGSLDVAAPPGAATARAGVAGLARTPGHPYATLAGDVEPALDAALALLASRGLPYVGGLDGPIRMVPTGLGATRPVSIVPAGQGAALDPWQPSETMVVCGIVGFKDLWPTAVAQSLARRRVWGVGPGAAPARIVPVVARISPIEDRRNLTGLHLARLFDDLVGREAAIDAIARAVDLAAVQAPARVALPAVLGLHDHAAVVAALQGRLGLPILELPLVPPSVPGLRLFDAFRSALRAAGVRIQLGEDVARVEAHAKRVDVVATPAAVREFAMRTEAVVLATGGLAGGGLVGRPDGTLHETVLDLPVEGPPRDDWFANDPFDAHGHPLEAAGVRTDADLRPVDRSGAVRFENVRVAGSLLAGQRWLHERCGDGVALTSAWRAAADLSRDGFRAAGPLPATADLTGAAVAATAGSPGAGR